jgi:hypothetical protein
MPGSARKLEAIMDLSEQWRLLSGIGGYVLFVAICGFVFYRAYRVRRQWLRIALGAAGILLIGIGGLAIWFDLEFVAGSRMRGPAIPSPDGKHVAVMYWIMAGAVGFDHVHVLLRSHHSPFTTEVYTGLAYNPPDDPTVSWQDNRRLLISYWQKGDTKACVTGSKKADDIEVLCQE